MASPKSRQLHIFFLPLLLQGHSIPSINMAKLFAFRGLKTAIVTTRINAQLHSKTIQSCQNLGLDIRVILIKFPYQEIGLPEQYENPHLFTTPELFEKFVEGSKLLDKQLEKLLEEHHPDCLVADIFFPWATDVAAKYGIPRVIFHGTGFFALCATLSILMYEPHEKVESDSEPFVIPNLPDEVKLMRSQLPPYVLRQNSQLEFSKLYKEGNEYSELRCFGIIVNSFYELECDYADHYRTVLGRKAWHIGPLSLSINKEVEGKGGSSIDEHECLKWLELKKPNSVVYVSFGSIANISDAQLMEIAIGLEASGQQFIWVVKKEKKEKEKEEWFPEGFEERIEGRGLIIRGWAPQVPILEHEAVGGFVTHCGWNSTIEAVSAGVPMVTWPAFSEQFYNEKLITQILRIGVGVGAKKWELELGDLVKRDAIKNAVSQVMEGEEAEDMRSRAKALSEMAKTAVGEGGSSYSDFNDFIEELGLLHDA